MLPSAALLRVAVLVAVASATARSASDAVCTQYAQDAVNAQQQNLNGRCGLAGDRWSLNYEGHRSWCLGASQASVDREANARRADLSKCSRCFAYAQEAIDAQRNNVTRQCGLSGDPWSDHYENHRSWCMRVSQADADRETANRSAELSKCDTCFAYGQQATNAQQQNLANQCGRAGDRWSLDFNGHRSWCMEASQSAIDGETNARNWELAKCTSCTAYAQQATAAQQKNLENQCGRSGDRWSSNFAGHKSWCMGAPQYAIDREAAARQYEVDRCAGVYREYTLAALDAQRQNIDNGCNLTGSRWSLNDQDHMNWCLFAPQAAIDWETEQRKIQINSCLATGRKAACDAYAKKAIEQFNAARNNSNCDRRDQRRWHDNYQNHYGWCMAVNAAESSAHAAFRDRELARCANGPRQET
jgi:hypothetical protein